MMATWAELPSERTPMQGTLSSHFQGEQYLGQMLSEPK